METPTLITISADFTLQEAPARYKNSCSGCYFDKFLDCLDIKCKHGLLCDGRNRKDGKSVIFKKVEL